MSDPSVQAAIATVRDYLLAGDPFESAVKDAAAEHGLVPALVARRFEMACGPAAEWLAKAAPALATLPTVAEKPAVLPPNAGPLTRAQAAAKAYAATKLNFCHGDGAALVGKPFVFNDEHYVFIALIRGCPKWGMRAVRVSDGAFRKMTLSVWHKVAAQVMG